MSSLTLEQQLAVDKGDANIIVSAGAGSGKTTVLKSRVLRILKSGIPINKLIILTFTNNAAQEMKERIRNIILDNEDVQSNLELIDSSYITTFDSFAQSLVKKYNYLLNIDKNFTIIDASLVNIEIDNIIDEIFEEKYLSDKNFQETIKVLCTKNDKEIRESLIGVYKKLTNIIDRESFLNNYINEYFSDKVIEHFFELYENHLFKLVDDIRTLYEELQNETIDEDTLRKNDDSINNFLFAICYDEILDYLDFSLASFSEKRYTEEGRSIKDRITEVKKSIKKYICPGKKSELIERYKSSKDIVEVIIGILKELDRRLMQFKMEHNAYEFHDIAFKAIELVSQHESVRNELKKNTFEIMIDEYQDTNDIQETFISYISNNNVYMVGDIKQSIYRFRNANPYIFKNKYDLYKENNNGFKIDLNKNFRSRLEVINSINLIFNNIMFDDVGGADYCKEHQIIYGNTAYDNFVLNDDYDLEILNYNNDDNKYLDSEAECFIIADDINKRIEAHEQVITIENNKMCSRDITYKDFVILADKSRNFNLLKKILESKNIPTTIDKDISIKEEDEIYILKNLINLIIHLKNKCYDINFKHAWISIARSYLYNMSDDEIFDIFQNNSFLDTDIIIRITSIAKLADSIGTSGLIKMIIDEFNITEKIIHDGDCRDKLSKLEIFINSAKSLNDFGMDIYSINDYFDELLNSDNDVKMTSNMSGANTVTIMTIHGSKGLEYPYVYMPFLNSNFTKKVSYPLYELTNKFGIIAPFNDNGYGRVFTYNINNVTERQEELSERIRLFYVAMTRAKEKIIIINKENLKIDPINTLTFNDLINVKCFSDFINILKYKLSKYIKNVDLEKLKIDKSYNNQNKVEFTLGLETESIETKELVIENRLMDNKHFSKALIKVIDVELKKRLDFGTYMHYCFEVFDFKNNNIEDLNISHEAKEKLINFLQHEEVKNIKNADIYKEKEIWYQDDCNTYHGFIDLLLEYDDHFDIIDYKLSNLNSKEYEVQLTGYKNYIESISNKPANIYLYSINKDVFKKL